MLRVLCVYFALISVIATSEIGCRDEHGHIVDWFVLYKLPKLSHHDDTEPKDFIRSGQAYTYMTEVTNTWTLSQYSINDTHSLPALTLDALYNGGAKSKLDDLGIGYVLYNDQADKVTVVKGHTKGVLLFDETSAVWIVHSIPHYPPKLSHGHYEINASQLVYGQSMLCMTVKYETLELIGKQFLYNFPQIYDYHIPNSLLNKDKNLVLDNLVSAIQGNHVTESPWFSINVIETFSNKHKFISFAKFTLFHDDLYTGLVAPSLKSNLETETWSNGAGTLSSNCTLKYHVMDIETVNFDSLNLTFTVHNDHSKWAITTATSSTSSITVTCIGDINRQEDQYVRGGGTLCMIDNPNMWKQYSNLVKEVNPCN